MLKKFVLVGKRGLCKMCSSAKNTDIVNNALRANYVKIAWEKKRYLILILISWRPAQCSKKFNDIIVCRLAGDWSITQQTLCEKHCSSPPVCHRVNIHTEGQHIHTAGLWEESHIDIGRTCQGHLAVRRHNYEVANNIKPDWKSSNCACVSEAAVT